MKPFFIISLISIGLLSGCALYQGLTDKSTPTPEKTPDKQAKTIATPPPAPASPGSNTSGPATTEAAKMISPVAH